MEQAENSDDDDDLLIELSNWLLMLIVNDRIILLFSFPLEFHHLAVLMEEF